MGFPNTATPSRLRGMPGPARGGATNPSFVAEEKTAISRESSGHGP